MAAPPAKLPPLDPAYAREYSGDTLRDVAIAFTVLEIVFVALRAFSQHVGRKPVGLDDWIIGPALVLCLGTNISSLLSLRLSKVGYHLPAVEETDPASLKPWAQFLYVTPILYSAAVCLPKVAILILYHRVFEQRSFRIINGIAMGVVIGIAIADILVGAFVCSPPMKLWEPSTPGTCIDIPAFYRYGTLPNAITDFFMLILPLPWIWRLQMPWRKRLGLTVTFLAGSVGLITSILRCVAFFTIDPLKDGTWASVTFLMWSNIEPGCYLIAACLLCFRPLINFVTGGWFDPEHSHNIKWDTPIVSIFSRRGGAMKFNSQAPERLTSQSGVSSSEHEHEHELGDLGVGRRVVVDVYSEPTSKDQQSMMLYGMAEEEAVIGSLEGRTRSVAKGFGC